jgi:tRNA threonylcarbamoyladenosine biosynthesis protein TsaB
MKGLGKNRCKFGSRIAWRPPLRISTLIRKVQAIRSPAKGNCSEILLKRVFLIGALAPGVANSWLGYNAYVIVLSIDTCDSRGSVALLQDDCLLQLIPHKTKDEYSSWLLPSVNEALRCAGVSMKDVGGYAVAAGPGSFTGVRVGLTTVKAWAEVYRKPVASVSRLEGIAAQVTSAAGEVAAFVDAQRGQVFGAIYEKDGDTLAILGEERVIAPEEFFKLVGELTGGREIAWISPDQELVEAVPGWKWREERGENIETASPILAGYIGRIGMRRLQDGKATDALALDANYVRRSDAEIFWKGAAHGH